MRISALLVLAILMAPAAFAAEVVVSPGASPEITVYNSDFGLVRENRTVRLPEGETRLAFTGVSRELQAETAAVQIGASDKVKPADVRIFDQTFAFNLMSPESLLEQAVGKDWPVSVLTTNPSTGRDVVERAKVLSVQNGLVLDIGGKIHTNHPGRIVFDSLPGNLRSAPTLLVTAAGPSGTDIPIEFSYLTGGLGWHADYVADYDSDAGRLTLSGWATITNTTGVEFKDAKLKLAAGQVNRVMPRPMPRPMARMEMAAAAPAAPDVGSESLDGLNLYTVARPVTLANGESKQLSLIRAAAVPAKRDTVMQGQPWYFTSSMAGQRQEGFAEVVVVVKNAKAAIPKGAAPEPVPGLGVALPAGVVRAYGQDATGAPQFLGEDRIAHIAEGGEIRLRLGRDVDVPVVREQVSYIRAAETIHLTTWKLTLRNAKARPVTVRVSEPIPGSWDITDKTQPHTKTDTGRAEWTVNLPAKGQVVLEYTVRTTM